MPESDAKKRSVTRNDSGDVRAAPVFHWMLNCQVGASGIPEWWSPARDWWLRRTVYDESTWSDAISIAITKMASLAWELESDMPRVRNYFQEMLLAADNNQSWVSFLSRHLRDFLTCDNGAFIEVVRSTSAAGSRILGLFHLDSLRCTRTGDPDYPVIYRDMKSVQHEMRAHQVITLSDMPDPSESWYGVGYCAASRAYLAIMKLASIERYIYDKVSGQRALAVDLVGGVSHAQMQTALDMAKEERAAKGQLLYMGAVVVPTLSDIPIAHTRINLAELPDGFDRKIEWDIALLQYANAIGMDLQELQPLSGQRLGTAMQSEVLNEKSKGKGLASWRQQFTHAINQFILPDSVTFAFSEIDLRDEQSKATVSKTRIEAQGMMIDKGILTAAQAAQMLADAKEIPVEFVPTDQTPGGTLTDTEKPESEAEVEDERQEQEQGEPPSGEIEETLKEIRDALARNATEQHERQERSRDMVTLAEAICDATTALQTAETKETPQQPMTVNITLPDISIPVTLPPSTIENKVNVQPTPVTIKSEPRITVEPATVKEAQPNVIVNVQPTPIKNEVNVPPAEVRVENTVNLPAAQQRSSTFKIQRNQYGQMVGGEVETVEQVETGEGDSADAK